MACHSKVGSGAHTLVTQPVILANAVVARGPFTLLLPRASFCGTIENTVAVRNDDVAVYLDVLDAPNEVRDVQTLVEHQIPHPSKLNSEVEGLELHALLQGPAGHIQGHLAGVELQGHCLPPRVVLPAFREELGNAIRTRVQVHFDHAVPEVQNVLQHVVGDVAVADEPAREGGAEPEFQPEGVCQDIVSGHR